MNSGLGNPFAGQESRSHCGQYRLRAARAWVRQIPLRLPFRFGKALMTELPVATVRLDLENERGVLFTGWGASGLPPMWFDKRDGRSLDANIADLLAAIREACAAGLQAPFSSPFGLHSHVQSETRKTLALQPDPMPPLAAGFGPALFEAALVDGLCRLQGKSLHALLREDGLGLGKALNLPEKPMALLYLRHTVGMADPLNDADLAASDRRNDGLPQTLSEVMEAYQPRYFKVKIGGGDEATCKRLLALAQLLDEEGGDYRLSLDGNEQWEDLTGFLALWRRLNQESRLQGFLKRILYVEQPVRRERSLDGASAGAARELAAMVPLLIDESDGEPGAAEKAFALGYTGVSVKLCKGLFRALHHLSLVEESKQKGLPCFLSSEDLTAVPALPLQQDLALAAALGLTHTERNGHHFAEGGLYLTGREADEALSAMPSLYAKGPKGEPRLKVSGGAIDLAEINAQGFGGHLIPDTFHQQPIFSLRS